MVPCAACIFCGFKFILVSRQEELSAKAFEEPITMDYAQFDTGVDQNQNEDEDDNPFE